jgi:Uma2 family endonuclease
MSNVLELPTSWDLLENGDRLTQPEFHRLYQDAPKEFKAELIEGEVFMASPVSWRHGFHDQGIAAVLYLYQGNTPGIYSSSNTTVILDEENEVQPDQMVWVSTEYGGTTSISDRGYLLGPPGLVFEIAASSRAIDLHRKRRACAKAGLPEYVVVVVEEKQLRVFDLVKAEEVLANEDGIWRSRQFPGLWINAKAYFANDLPELLNTLQQGLASTEHAAFVELLASRRVLTSTTGS